MRKLSMHHREVCMCLYCLNIKYKLLALNYVSSQNTIDRKVDDDRQLLDILLCAREDGKTFHRYECIFGQCDSCKDIKSTLRKFYACLPNVDVTWSHWARVQCDYDGKIRRNLVTHKKSVQDLLTEFESDIIKPCQGTTFMEHTFIANWQSQQFNMLKNELPSGWVMMIMDFAKNRAVHYQDEIKSAFFGKGQITMHPTVIYYRDTTTKELKRESHVFISDDTVHDFHAVNYFFDKSIADLSKRIQLSKVIIYSDGCGSQYKSRGPLVDLSSKCFGTEHSYFGSEHGKSESDGETGMINVSVDRAIIGRKVIINNAQDMMNWCSTNLASEVPSKRIFFLVKRDEVDRTRPDTDVQTVQGVRKFHQIQSMGMKYKILARNLSCYCYSCRGNKTTPIQCTNADYVHKFKPVQIKPKRPIETVDELLNVVFPMNNLAEPVTSQIEPRHEDVRSTPIHHTDVEMVSTNESSYSELVNFDYRDLLNFLGR